MIAPESPAAPARTLTLTAGGQAQFCFPKEAALNEALFAVFGKPQDWFGPKWNGTRRAWTVKVRAANILQIRTFADTHGFSGVAEADALRGRIREKAHRHMVASRAAFDEDFPLPATLGGTARPFQRAGVRYIVEVAKGRCLVADEMGLGKTVEAMVAIETMAAFPAVIVCPASLQYNWLAELKRWLPGRKAEIWKFPDSGTSGNADVTILSYDKLSEHVEALRALKPQAVVFDEGHLLKSRTAQRTVAAKRLREGVRVRLVLTGTPVLNRPSELIAPLCLLGRLEDVGGFDHFAKRYCAGKIVEKRQRGTTEKRKVTDLTGASHLPELAGRLRATCMLRRFKKDVLTELPAKQTTVLPVDLSAAAAREYDAAARDVLAWVAKKAGRDPEFRASISGLDADAQLAAVLTRAQAAADRAGQAEELVKIEALKQISARGKLASAKEWIGNVLASGEKLVVFAWHQETLDALAQEFPKAPVLSGETPTWARQRIVDRFQAEKECPLVLMNLQAGGVGLTLTAASHVLILELPWTPAALDQAIDRLHRIGQTSRVNAWVMLARRTIDFAIWKMIGCKRTTTEGATR